ncbi:hypothetical protein KEM55_005426 [Ascosphaera atra]|nr:hypothetical protein KEM55_005426 [Ascosphaera atra]
MSDSQRNSYVSAPGDHDFQAQQELDADAYRAGRDAGLNPGTDFSVHPGEEGQVQGRVRQHRSGHQSFVPTDQPRPRRQQRHSSRIGEATQQEGTTEDEATQLPNALARASPEVKDLLATVDDNTRAMAAAVYHDSRNQDTASLDRLVLQLVRASSAAAASRLTPRSSSGNSLLASHPTVGTHPTMGEQALRRPRDLASPPKYDGERRNAAARRWLRQCAEYFRLEQLLTNVTSTSEQRVALATTWLKGTAWNAWQSHLDASFANPSIALPKTWEKFQEWLLNRAVARHEAGHGTQQVRCSLADGETTLLLRSDG